MDHESRDIKNGPTENLLKVAFIIIFCKLIDAKCINDRLYDD